MLRVEPGGDGAMIAQYYAPVSDEVVARGAFAEARTAIDAARAAIDAATHAAPPPSERGRRREVTRAH